MELLVLGASHGVPTPHRHCSSTLLKCGDSYYLIDAGAPVADLMIQKGLAFEKLRAVFLTHRHSDHVIGLAHVCNLATWRFRESRFTCFFPEQDCIDGLKGYLRCMDDIAEDRILMECYGNGTVYQDENIKVTAIPTNHMNGVHPSYAFVIDGEGKRVIFTGDLQVGEPLDFPEVAHTEPSDAIVCELAHFTMPVLLPYLCKCSTKHIYFNHYLDQRSVEAAMEVKNQNILPFPIDVLRDGDSIQL